MRKYLGLLAVMMGGALTGVTLVAPLIRQMAGPAVNNRAAVYHEQVPTNPYKSISAQHFARLLSKPVDRSSDPAGGQAALSLTVLSENGDALPYVRTPERQDTEIFASIWNYTNQRQALALTTLTDYQVAPMHIDGRNATELYPVELLPNQAIDIPLSLPTGGLTPGMHELTFIIVRRPDAHAEDDQVAAGICCSIERLPLWVGAGEPAAQEVGKHPDEVSFSFRIVGPERSMVQTAANQPFALQADVEASTPWKVITLIDFTREVASLTGSHGKLRRAFGHARSPGGQARGNLPVPGQPC